MEGAVDGRTPLNRTIGGQSLSPHSTQSYCVDMNTDAMDNRTTLQLSVMLAVPDAARASEWYQRALGAEELWNVGSVIGLVVGGAPLFLGEPANNGWDHPGRLGMPSVRVEVFCDDPDAFIAHALAAGALDRADPVREHQTIWGPHRQGSFLDPFGHLWFVGDRSPLQRYHTE